MPNPTTPASGNIRLPGAIGSRPAHYAGELIEAIPGFAYGQYVGEAVITDTNQTAIDFFDRAGKKAVIPANAVVYKLAAKLPAGLKGAAANNTLKVATAVNAATGVSIQSGTFPSGTNAPSVSSKLSMVNLFNTTNVGTNPATYRLFAAGTAVGTDSVAGTGVVAPSGETRKVRIEIDYYQETDASLDDDADPRFSDATKLVKFP